LFSSTGLAVTGALSSTTGANFATSSGNVGIGTATPVTLKSSVTLQVLGNTKLGNANDRGLLSLGDIGSNDANVGVWRGAAGAYGAAGSFLCLGGFDGITFATGNSEISTQTERMRIDSSGNVGIGTTAPATRLQLTTTDGVYLTIGHSNWSTKHYAGIGGIVFDGNDNTRGSMLFYTRQNSLDANLTERMRIDYNGNVGIGTTSPTDKLDVNGTVILRSNVSTSSVIGINRNSATGAILDATKHAYQFVCTAAGIDFEAYNTAGTSLGNAFSISGVNTTFGGAIAIGNTVNTVSPTSPNRTITMVIGGTTYYIHAKTTND
jgi:hypothetical protein